MPQGGGFVSGFYGHLQEQAAAEAQAQAAELQRQRFGLEQEKHAADMQHKLEEAQRAKDLLDLQRKRDEVAQADHLDKRADTMQKSWVDGDIPSQKDVDFVRSRGRIVKLAPHIPGMPGGAVTASTTPAPSTPTAPPDDSASPEIQRVPEEPPLQSSTPPSVAFNGPTSAPSPQPTTVMPEPQGPPPPPVPVPAGPMTGGMRLAPSRQPGAYLGSPQEQYVQRLPEGSDIRKAAEYELYSNRNAPAGLFNHTSTNDTLPAMWSDPQTGDIERRIDGKWVPWKGDVPAKAHWVTTKDEKGGGETSWQLKNWTDAKTGEEQVYWVNPKTQQIRKAEGVLPMLAGSQRAQRDSAQQVVSHFAETRTSIEEADKRGLLGPLQGRWADFLAGKIGSTGNPENDQLLGDLRTDILLIKSGTTRAHFGARGGITYIEKMDEVLNSDKMSKAALLGSLTAAERWLSTYSKDPRTSKELLGSAGTKSDTATPPPSGGQRIRYDMNGNVVK